MKSIVLYGTGDVRVENLPNPKPNIGELLIRPLAVGICFSDLRAYKSKWSPYRPGVVIGHEGCGEIIDKGSHTDEWKIGERVIVNPILYCGRCVSCLMGDVVNCLNWDIKTHGFTIGASALRKDDNSLYHGLMADLCVVPASKCYHVPENVDVVAAANIEVIASALQAVRHSGVLPGDNVVFMGLDDYNAVALKLILPTKCVVVDPIEVRRKLASRLGADLTLNPTEANTLKEIYNFMPVGADIVFVANEDYIESSSSYANLAHKIVRAHGTIFVMRFQSGDIGNVNAVNVSFIKRVEIKLAGVFGDGMDIGGNSRSDYQMAIDGVASGRINGTSHVSRVLPFKDIKNTSDIRSILDMLPEKETKIVITM
jgi:threonine dehydrogenase-like Zn-dependent dehydrogenase